MCNDLFEKKMTNAADVERFVYAGRALFTIQSKKTGVRFTYKIQKKRGEKKPKLLFVKVLQGPNNETDYGYLGYVKPQQHGEMFAGQKGRPTAASYKALAWALDKICAGELPDQLEFYHSGQCGACGRTLTVPESIETGLGPVCASKG